MKKQVFILMTALLVCIGAGATTWHVGPAQTYTMPSQVSTLVANGDTVLIDSGLYNSDVARWTADDLVLKGINGKAILHSGGLVYGGKAIWVIAGDNALVENIDFAEASCIDQNGAGIRLEGTDLTVRSCYFHDNEDGILTGADTACDILIEYCEFYNNGYGDGYSHNLYIGHAKSLTFRYNYTHHASVGHELKSRAERNYILYNRFGEEASGTASRSIDLPNGGLAIIVGNVIEQGPNSQNSNMVGYGLEGTSNSNDTSVYLINNTMVNNKSTGSFLQVASGTSYCRMKNNLFAGPGTKLSGNASVVDSSNNWAGTITAAGFINAAGYDFDILSSSPVIDMGTNPGMAGTYSLTPTYEYADTASAVPRNVNGAPDAGAYEYGQTSSSVYEVNRVNAFTVYPNPCNGKFSIAINDAETKRILIHDGAGRPIQSIPVNGRSVIVDLSAQAAGVYYISSEQSGGVVKVVVQ